MSNEPVIGGRRPLWPASLYWYDVGVDVEMTPDPIIFEAVRTELETLGAPGWYLAELDAAAADDSIDFGGPAPLIATSMRRDDDRVTIQCSPMDIALRRARSDKDRLFGNFLFHLAPQLIDGMIHFPLAWTTAIDFVVQEKVVRDKLSPPDDEEVAVRRRNRNPEPSVFEDLDTAPFSEQQKLRATSLVWRGLEPDYRGERFPTVSDSNLIALVSHGSRRLEIASVVQVPRNVAVKAGRQILTRWPLVEFACSAELKQGRHLVAALAALGDAEREALTRTGRMESSYFQDGRAKERLAYTKISRARIRAAAHDAAISVGDLQGEDDELTSGAEVTDAEQPSFTSTYLYKTSGTLLMRRGDHIRWNALLRGLKRVLPAETIDRIEHDYAYSSLREAGDRPYLASLQPAGNDLVAQIDSCTERAFFALIPRTPEECEQWKKAVSEGALAPAHLLRVAEVPIMEIASEITVALRRNGPLYEAPLITNVIGTAMDKLTLGPIDQRSRHLWQREYGLATGVNVERLFTNVFGEFVPLFGANTIIVRLVGGNGLKDKMREHIDNGVHDLVEVALTPELMDGLVSDWAAHSSLGTSVSELSRLHHGPDEFGAAKQFMISPLRSPGQQL